MSESTDREFSDKEAAYVEVAYTEALHWTDFTRREAIALALFAVVAAGMLIWWGTSRASPAEVSHENAETVEPAKVDLNQASASELTLIPGVGKATAKRIVAEREERGPFQSLEDFMTRVRGLQRAKIESFAKHMEFGQ